MDEAMPAIEGALETNPETAFDVEAFARELDDVEAALARLDDGSYWFCEVTGDPLPAELLATDPIARRRSRLLDGSDDALGSTTEDRPRH